MNPNPQNAMQGRFFAAPAPDHVGVRALLAKTKVESGDVSKQKWNLFQLLVTVENQHT